ncbi:MAG: radical SAM protein, partial [Bdellovibrionaceae bacterium]|nr:radical SAM protein [Pseudobdellovibrionaceae bacterium]
MDLILKPTEACNFSCSFCSSTNISKSKAQILDLDLVSQFLERFPETRTIIINGGDPTMVPVSYYWDLIRRLNSLNSSANISITTNLWKFWLEWQNDAIEKKWTELFRSPRVNVTTSFQYGESRRITRSRVFTEQDFVKISNL